MNPELPQVNRTPEVQPQNVGGGEYNVENTSLKPEIGRESEQSLGARVEQYNNIPVALPVDNTTTVPLISISKRRSKYESAGGSS